MLFSLSMHKSSTHSSQVPVWPVVSMPAKKRAAISGVICESLSGFPVKKNIMSAALYTASRPAGMSTEEGVRRNASFTAFRLSR